MKHREMTKESEKIGTIILTMISKRTIWSTSLHPEHQNIQRIPNYLGMLNNKKLLNLNNDDKLMQKEILKSTDPKTILSWRSLKENMASNKIKLMRWVVAVGLVQQLFHNFKAGKKQTMFQWVEVVGDHGIQ